LSRIDKRTTELLQADRSEASLQLANDSELRGRLWVNKWTAALPACFSPVHQV